MKKNKSCLNFLKLRKRIGLTQFGISKEIEISRPTVGAIEEGRANVSVDFFLQLVENGFLDKSEMFDFYFNEKFIPQTDIYFIQTTVKNTFQKVRLNKKLHDRINHSGSH